MTTQAPMRAPFRTLDYSEEAVVPLVRRREPPRSRMRIVVDKRGLVALSHPREPSVPRLSSLLREQEQKDRMEERIAQVRRRAIAMLFVVFAGGLGLGLGLRTPALQQVTALFTAAVVHVTR
jgi:hypothetical protein